MGIFAKIEMDFVAQWNQRLGLLKTRTSFNTQRDRALSLHFVDFLLAEGFGRIEDARVYPNV
jgi:hypothetical protein